MKFGIFYEHQLPRPSALSVEDAHLSAFDERLGADRSKTRTEDAHLSTFDTPEDFRDSPLHVGSKMLNSPHVSIFGRGERLPRAPEDAPTWGPRASALASSNTTVRSRASGPRASPGSIPTVRLPTYP
jgi:hypothetical protein